MATKFSVDAKKTDTFLINPKDILRPIDTGRAFDADINDLKDSLKKHGQLQPVGVRKNSDSKPVLVFGHSRVRAILELNEESGGEPMLVKCVLITCNEQEAFEQTLVENFDRKAVSPIDTAFNMRVLRDRYGKSDDDIAAIYRKSKSWVAQHWPLLSLDRPEAYKVHVGEMSLDAALTLCKVPEAKRAAVVQKAAAKSQAEPMSSAKVSALAKAREALAKAKADREGKKPAKPKISKAAIEEAAAEERGEKPVTKPKLVNVAALVMEYNGIPAFRALDRFITGALSYQEVSEELQKLTDEL